VGSVQQATGHRRPALDGIRALAVLAVGIYHFGGAERSWLPGGFLGIDVFFVLSGYLITELLLAEYQRRGRIDLPRFWFHRVRRLGPALVAMLLFVYFLTLRATPLSGFPAQLSDLRQTVRHLANWHLIQPGANDFAAFATASPLRHTWALVVAEQFYVFWPLVLIGLLWLGRTWATRVGGHSDPGPVIVVVIATAGIALSAWAMASSYHPAAPAAAYSATSGRVQELFVGVLLAVLIRSWRRGARDRRYSEPIGILLALGLLSAFDWMSNGEPFYYRGGALAVSLLAAALIAVVELRPEETIGRVLSWRPAVWLGQISYGVYLWHWPIVLLIPVSAAESSSDRIWHQTQRVLLTVLLATLSHHFLEHPVRRHQRWLTTKPRVLVTMVAVTGLLMTTTQPAVALPGPLAQQLAETSDSPCPGERPDLLLACTKPETSNSAVNPPEIALLGDSTGRALAPGLDEWARASGTTWIQAAWQRCTPLDLMVTPTNLPVPDPPAITCHAQAPALIRNMLATYRPRVVLIAEFWDSVQSLMVNGAKIPADTAAHDTALRLGYQKLVDEIAEHGGRTVFLELPPPGFAIDDPTTITVTGGGRTVNRYNAILRSVAQSRPELATTVSLTDVICPGGACQALSGNMVIRSDGVHYPPYFSRRLVPVLMQRIGLHPLLHRPGRQTVGTSSSHTVGTSSSHTVGTSSSHAAGTPSSHSGADERRSARRTAVDSHRVLPVAGPDLIDKHLVRADPRPVPDHRPNQATKHGGIRADHVGTTGRHKVGRQVVGRRPAVDRHGRARQPDQVQGTRRGIGPPQ
jgi:peptidoglycan/LPS O-acetylase OafA/YrhL